MIIFEITCPVEAFADITPSIVRFEGPVGTAMKEQVRITPSGEQSFKIIDAKAQRGNFIRFEVKEAKDDSGKDGYMVEIENTKTDAGAFHDIIMLDTDSKVQPQLKIRVFGRFLDPTAGKNKNAIMADPPQEQQEAP